MRILATGATGRFAGLVVSALVNRGLEVRALVHDPDKSHIPVSRGAAETVTGDLSAPASLHEALDGVDGAFLVTPAFAPDATRMGLNLIDAARKAGVGKLVYNGVYHPSLDLENHASTRPIEAALYTSGLNFTVLQPAIYMQGIDPMFERAIKTGQLIMPWSMHSMMTYVDYRDVADAAALSFLDERLSFGTFELAAAGMTNGVGIASLISAATDHKVIAADPPPGSGPPPAQVTGLAAMFAEYHQHGFRGGNPLVLRTILGREPRTVTAYITELAKFAQQS